MAAATEVASKAGGRRTAPTRAEEAGPEGAGGGGVAMAPPELGGT
jgi:hypothetical protein